MHDPDRIRRCNSASRPAPSLFPYSPKRIAPSPFVGLAGSLLPSCCAELLLPSCCAGLLLPCSLNRSFLIYWAGSLFLFQWARFGRCVPGQGRYESASEGRRDLSSGRCYTARAGKHESLRSGRHDSRQRRRRDPAPRWCTGQVRNGRISQEWKAPSSQ